MDSRDSSSSTIANRDAFSGDDDGVLSVTAALAKDAALCFQSRKFAECVDFLNQLKLKNEDNPKVHHNIAIAEYCRNGCTDTKRLLEVLNNVKKQKEYLAHAPGEQTEANNLGNNVNLVSKGSTGTLDSGSNGFFNQFDTSAATLNIAVIWFHLQEYAKALSVLEPLYQNIEPIDETTALQIRLLLLDVCIACKMASKSGDVLNYLDKTFGGGYTNQGEIGSTTQQSTNLVSKSYPVQNSSLVADANSDLAASINSSENSLSRTLSDETLDYDNVFEIGGQNLARSVGLSHSNDISRVTIDRSISTVDLKLKLQLYKVRFLLLTGNLRLAKREIKHAMNIARGRDSSMALLLKSQLEYARGNHRKAEKLLDASNNRTDMWMSILNNNLACISYRQGNYQVAWLLFSKALASSSSLRKENPHDLWTFSRDKSLCITYNCGLLELARGNPIFAARCFQKAGLMFRKQPVMWLRLAECCLMAFQKGLLKGCQSPSSRSEVKVNVVGKGKWRQLVVGSNISKNNEVVSVGKDDLVLGTDKQPNLSLRLAWKCITNALILLNSPDSSHSKCGLAKEIDVTEAASSKNSNQNSLSSVDPRASNIAVSLGPGNANGDLKEQKGGTIHEMIRNSISCYEVISNRENLMLKQALHANLAYVELELDNPLKALSYATSLLELQGCSKIYIFLAHVYAAEALCLLKRPKQAAEHLSVYLSGEEVQFPFQQEDGEQWRAGRSVDCEELNGGGLTAAKSHKEERQDSMFQTPEEARGALYSNLASVFAIQGDLERASHFVTQALSLVPDSCEATLTAVYVDALLGKSEEAIDRLKKSRCVRFLPDRALQLSKSS